MIKIVQMYGEKVVAHYDLPQKSWVGGHHPHGILKSWQLWNLPLQINYEQDMIKYCMYYSYNVKDLIHTNITRISATITT